MRIQNFEVESIETSPVMMIPIELGRLMILRSECPKHVHFVIFVLVIRSFVDSLASCSLPVQLTGVSIQKRGYRS